MSEAPDGSGASHAGCPDEDVLIEYTRGILSQHGKARLESHLDGCERCRLAVSALARRVSVHSAEYVADIDTQPENTNPIPGTVLAERFRLVNFLGVGAMGVVYEAEDLKLAERIALKVLAPHIAERRDVLDFLRREISLGRRVAHPHVCPVYDMGISGSYHFITMKLVEGKTLDQLLDDGPLPPERIEHLLSQLVDALSAAHSQGVVHRDLKSANIMVAGDGHLWVMDFGLARDLERDPSFSGPVGTPAYWSPEQALGEAATPASDVYSFGVVAYRLWTGKLPRRHKEKTNFADIPRPWNAIVERCLAEQLSKRFQSGAEIKRALDEAKAQPRRWGLGAAAVGLMVVTSFMTWLLSRPMPAPAAPTELDATESSTAPPAPVTAGPAVSPPNDHAMPDAATATVDAGSTTAASPGTMPEPTSNKLKKDKPRSNKTKPDDIPLFE